MRQRSIPITSGKHEGENCSRLSDSIRITDLPLLILLTFRDCNDEGAHTKRGCRPQTCKHLLARKSLERPDVRTAWPRTWSGSLRKWSNQRPTGRLRRHQFSERISGFVGTAKLPRFLHDMGCDEVNRRAKNRRKVSAPLHAAPRQLAESSGD